jgi:hypothetical protein
MNFGCIVVLPASSMNFIEIYNDLVCTSQETSCASNAKANRIIHFKKITVIRSGNRKKYKNVLYGINTDSLNVKPNGAYVY